MIGGLGLSVVLTVFLVPAVYLVIHGRRGMGAEVAR
jgi:multidrug efflux pump subunit AcrB